jgi:hypothetical protein
MASPLDIHYEVVSEYLILDLNVLIPESGIFLFNVSNLSLVILGQVEDWYQKRMSANGNLGNSYEAFDNNRPWQPIVICTSDEISQRYLFQASSYTFPLQEPVKRGKMIVYLND